MTTSLQDICTELSDAARQSGRRIATAESLTAGSIAAEIGRAKDSAEWYLGGIVAYNKAVKHSVLHVPLGPVVSEDAARTMAHAVATMMGANLALAVTGEAGPEPLESAPVGTVWFGIADHGTVSAENHHFDGDPARIVEATVEKALQLLVARIRATR